MNNFSIRTTFRFSIVSLLVIGFTLLISGCDDDDNNNTEKPIVKNVRPASGFPGETVFISGENFSTTLSDNIVSFNNVVGDVVSMSSDTLLEVTVPEDASTGYVVVGNRAHAAYGPLFTVGSNMHPPVLTGISTASAEIGETIVLTGKNFDIENPHKNFVFIGPTKAEVINATATTVTVLVPSRTAGNGKAVTVTVAGAKSNALSLDVSGVTGSIYWGVMPQNNVPLDNRNQFVVVAEPNGADSDRTILIPDDTAQTRELLKYQLSSGWGSPFPMVMSQTEDAVYYINTDQNKVQKVSTTWGTSDFQDVYNGDDVGYYFSYATAITENKQNDALLIAMLDLNTWMYSIFVASKDGADISTFSAGPFNQIKQLACGKQYLYVLEVGGTLKRVALTGDGTPEVVDVSSLVEPSSNNAGGVQFIGYSSLDESLYMFYEDVYTAPFKVSRLGENSGAIEIVGATNGAPQTEFSVLESPTGAKLYYQHDGTIYMLNTKFKEARGVSIYHDVTALKNRPETAVSNVYQVYMLLVDNN